MGLSSSTITVIVRGGPSETIGAWLVTKLTWVPAQPARDKAAPMTNIRVRMSTGRGFMTVICAAGVSIRAQCTQPAVALQGKSVNRMHRALSRIVRSAGPSELRRKLL
jgi:hypothetical protein